MIGHETEGIAALPLWRRRAVRVLFVSMLAIMVFDTTPWSAARMLGVVSVKEKVTELVAVLGLWQGEWSLFAPNPEVTNKWLSVELIDGDEVTHQWDSPYWGSATCWEKFRRFRHMNYYTRLQAPMNRAAARDLVRYFATQLVKERDGSFDVRLVLSGFNLSVGEPVVVPSDEVTWVTSSEVIATAVVRGGEVVEVK